MGLFRATSGSGGGSEISKVYFCSGRTSGVLTMTFPEAVDVVYFQEHTTAFDNLNAAVQMTRKLERGESVIFSGVTISFSADGLSVSKTSGNIGYYGCTGIIFE